MKEVKRDLFDYIELFLSETYAWDIRISKSCRIQTITNEKLDI